MTPNQRHLFDCARDVITAVANATMTADGVPELESWAAYREEGAIARLPHFCHCTTEAAMMIIWLLARDKYATPAEFIAEAGTLLGPMVLGDRV